MHVCSSRFWTVLERASKFAALTLILGSFAVWSPLTGQAPPSERRVVDRAERLLHGGQAAEARTVLTEYLSRAPASMSALSLLSELMLKLDEQLGFLEFAESAVAAASEDPAIRELWVKALLGAGFRDSARAVAKRWIMQSPDEAKARIVRTEVELVEGDTANAIRFLQEGGRRTDEVVMRLAELLLAMGRSNELVIAWSELLGFDPPLVEVVVEGLEESGSERRRRLEFLRDELKGRTTGRTARAGALVELRVRDTEIARELAVEASGAGELQDAAFLRDYVREADETGLPGEVAWAAYELVKLSPRPSDRLRWRTVVADQSLADGDTASAQLALVELARESEPGEDAHDMALRRLFNLLVTDPESLGEAGQLLESYSIAYPDSLRPESGMRSMLAIGYARAGDLAAGEEALQVARARMPRSVFSALDASAARLSFYAGRRDSAIAQARRALSEEGLEAAERTRRLQLLTLVQAADSSEVAIVGEGALDLLRDPGRFDPIRCLGALANVPQTAGRPMALLYLADVAATAGRYEVARTFRLQVVERHSNSAEAPLALLALARAADRSEAARWLERLIVGYPESALAPMARRLLTEIPRRLR